MTVRTKRTPKTLNRYAKSMKELIDIAKSNEDWSSIDQYESNIGYLQDLIDFYRLKSDRPIKHFSFFEDEDDG